MPKVPFWMYILAGAISGVIVTLLQWLVVWVRSFEWKR
jgi:hypothetical protein